MRHNYNHRFYIMLCTSYNVICQLPTNIVVVKYKEEQNIVVLCCLQLSSIAKYYNYYYQINIK